MTGANVQTSNRGASPGAGACGEPYPSNKVPLTGDFEGMRPLGLSSVPATNAGKANAGHRAGELVLDLLRRDVTPAKIITKTAIENAITGVAATGGSTNAVLHLLPIANEPRTLLSITDFDRISC